jgi:1,4-dihydroxy-2-naphthoate octaprenyltransferase
MEKSNPSLARLIWQYTRPMALLMGLLFYVLGLAISGYLANPLQWQKAIMGLTCILLLQLVCTYTKGFYDFSDARADRLLTPEGAKRRSLQELRRIQLTFLVLILTVLTAGAVLTVSLLAEGWIWMSSSFWEQVSPWLSSMQSLQSVWCTGDWENWWS